MTNTNLTTKVDPPRSSLRRMIAAVTTTVALLAVSFAVAPVAPASAAVLVDSPASLAAEFTAGGDITLDQDITVRSTDAPIIVGAGKNVTLDLAGNQLSIAAAPNEAGIGVPSPAALTVSDSVGGGILTVTGSGGGSGIGGSAGVAVGDITIESGEVTAEGGMYGAGIGGGMESAVRGTITISGGNVTARGGGGGASQGAGIGGGFRGAGGNVVISGGTVVATGVLYGAAIGGGFEGSGATVTIGEDAIVTVTGTRSFGGGYAAGGFGSLSNAGTLVLDGIALSIPAGVTVSNSGTIDNQGRIDVIGALANSGSIINPNPQPTSTDSTRVSGFNKVTENNFVVTFNASPAADTGMRVFASSLTNAKIALPAPTRVGHSFTGWFTAATDGTRWTADSTISANTTVYAQWTADPRTVSFDSQGGTPVADVTAGYGSAIDAPTVPTRTGYTFKGWFTAASAGSLWKFSDVVTADVTLYAQWTVDPRTVTFDVQGGTAVAPVNTVYGTVIPAPTAPTRTGHTFTGWFTKASGGVAWKFTDAVTENVTVFAQWAADPRTVSFDSRGGTPIADVTTGYGSAIAAPTAPTRVGHTFTGWSTAATAGVLWKFADAVTKNITLYAQWTIDPVVVTFDVQGGTAVAPVRTVYGEIIDAPTTPPTRTGHTFTGWFTAASDGVAWKFADAVTEDVTVFAQWSADPRTVSFDSQGGTPVAAVNTVYGTVIDAPAAPTRADHTFTGWFTKASGGVAWKFADAVTENVTVYAQWTVDLRTVTFHVNGGTAVAPVTIGSGSPVAAPTAPTRTGHTFVGWFTTLTDGVEWNFSDVITVNRTLYARWAEARHTVTFNAQGGTAVDAVDTAYGTTIAAPATPTRAGHTFVGWYTKAVNGVAWNFSYDVKANTTLFAQWTPVKAGTTVTTHNVPADIAKAIPYDFDVWGDAASFAPDGPVVYPLEADTYDGDFSQNTFATSARAPEGCVRVINGFTFEYTLDDYWFNEPSVVLAGGLGTGDPLEFDAVGAGDVIHSGYGDFYRISSGPAVDRDRVWVNLKMDEDAVLSGTVAMAYPEPIGSAEARGYIGFDKPMETTWIVDNATFQVTDTCTSAVVPPVVVPPVVDPPVVVPPVVDPPVVVPPVVDPPVVNPPATVVTQGLPTTGVNAGLIAAAAALLLGAGAAALLFVQRRRATS